MGPSQPRIKARRISEYLRSGDRAKYFGDTSHPRSASGQSRQFAIMYSEYVMVVVVALQVIAEIAFAETSVFVSPQTMCWLRKMKA